MPTFALSVGKCGLEHLWKVNLSNGLHTLRHAESILAGTELQEHYCILGKTSLQSISHQTFGSGSLSGTLTGWNKQQRNELWKVYQLLQLHLRWDRQ